MRDKGPGRHSGHRYSARRLRQRRAVKITAAGAIALVVGVGLAVAIRPVIGGATLEASASPSGPLFGAPASSAGQLAQNSGKFGTLGIIRTTYTGLPAAKAWSTAPLGTTKSAVLVSFAAPPTAILAGRDDAALRSFFRTAPRGRPVYYAYYSEPEAAVNHRLFTPAGYRQAWTHIAALAHAAHNSGLKATLILRASDLGPASRTSWRSFLPGGHVVAAVAWDAYPAGTATGASPKLTEPETFMGPAVAAAKAAGLAFGFAGFALATTAGRPGWLYSVADYLMSSGARFGILTTLRAVPATNISDAASIAAWRAVVARSGTENRFPVGPVSPTPPPTTSPPVTPSPAPTSTAPAAPTPTPTPTATQTPPLTPPPGNSAAQAVCGQSILNSPYDYTGSAGPYSSGTAGLPTFGTAGSDFPNDTAGAVLPAGTKDYASYELQPDTVYYLLPGTHVGSIQADAGDSFVGGLAGGQATILSGNYSQSEGWAIDSNWTNGNQPGVTIEYLTIEKYTPGQNAAAINQDTNTGWTLKYNTVTLNVPGAGILAGSDNTIEDNCLTLNGQYGFQAFLVNTWGRDSLTGGPYDITAADNEISYNDTCDYSGLLDNSAIGWKNYNPVPAQYQNPQCGQVTPDGDQGGFKLWRTDGVTVKDNYIHNNWGPGAWNDTGNANTTIAGNAITDNEGQAIVEEISYNFSITGNYMAGNDITDGLANAGFPQPAVYISNAGSDTALGAVPACPEASCTSQGAYPDKSVIANNTLVDNGGNIFLWQDSNRFCSDSQDGMCTLVDGGPSSPFTMQSCAANLPSATISTSAFAGNKTGSPAEDWWDGCQWETANVSVTGNVIDFNRANISHCNQADWPACGDGGTFSEYGSPNKQPAWAVATELTFFQGNSWADNTYNGPSTFVAWNQGNLDSISWANWTGNVSAGDKCESAQEQQSGTCTGPFGQDSGSSYSATPVTTNP
jgi:hypothetical protein